MTLKMQVEQASAQGMPLKLQLGCGANVLPGWVNTDSEPPPVGDYLNFNRRFPFADGMFIAVFCEHTLEHITKPEAIRMIGEVFRVLRAGGAFRVVTPDLEGFCRMVLDPASPIARRYVEFFRAYSKDADATIVDAFNLTFYGHGHRHIWTVNELGRILGRAGFVDIKAMRAETYANSVFTGVDGHGRVVGPDINAIEAMALEAIKP